MIEKIENKNRTKRASRPAADSRAVMDTIRRVVRALRVSSRLSQGRLGLSGAQLFVLRTLEAAPREGLSINELAARTRTHQSSVSVVVSRLEAASLVSRTPARDDARVSLISLTAEGSRKLARAPVSPQEKLVEAIEGLDARDRSELRRLLEVVIHNAGLEAGPAPMFFEDSHHETSGPS